VEHVRHTKSTMLACFDFSRFGFSLASFVLRANVGVGIVTSFRKTDSAFPPSGIASPVIDILLEGTSTMIVVSVTGATFVAVLLAQSTDC
jgi:hypothetical protein